MVADPAEGDKITKVHDSQNGDRAADLAAHKLDPRLQIGDCGPLMHCDPDETKVHKAESDNQQLVYSISRCGIAVKYLHQERSSRDGKPPRDKNRDQDADQKARAVNSGEHHSRP